MSHAPPVWDGRSTNDRNIDLPLEVPVTLLASGRNRIHLTATDPEPHILVAEILVLRSAEQLQQEVCHMNDLNTRHTRREARNRVENTHGH
jgi:hypothetical protein